MASFGILKSALKVAKVSVKNELVTTEIVFFVVELLQSNLNNLYIEQNFASLFAVIRANLN